MPVNFYILGGFSNYFNRMIKRFSTVSEYTTAVGNNYQSYTKRNFNPNDDVDTTIVENWSKSWAPDYLLVVNENNTIVSRWFVLEIQRTRGSQYVFTLHRDVVADYYDNILDATTFVEKATLSPTDPLIFNSENFSTNRIKKNETLLKDETGVGWIVGYISRGNNYSASADVAPQTSYKTFSDFNTEFGVDLYNEHTLKLAYDATIYYGVNTNTTPEVRKSKYYYLYLNNNYECQYCRYEEKVDRLGDPFSVPINLIGNPTAAHIDGFAHALERNFDGFINLETLQQKMLEDNGAITVEQFNKIFEQSGIILHDSINNKYFKFMVEKVPTLSLFTTKRYSVNSVVGVNLDQIVSNTITEKPYYNGTNNDIQVVYGTYQYRIVLSQITFGTYNINVVNGRNKLEDAPYDMFCIPYGEVNLIDNNTLITTSKDVNLLLAQELAGELGTALYDIQLLPFCPIREISTNFTDENAFDAWAFDLSILSEDKDYSFITKDEDGGGTSKVGAIFWAKKSSGTFNILTTMQMDISDLKAASELDMYRLCSPNYNGIFEFNAAKNGGVEFFNVDFTYKPFNPYIHINPNFNRLYGQDFDDARGLIFGGDFSVAVATDQWAQFEINNKNYQNIFDREIQNLEFSQRQERINTYINLAGGSVQGGATGAMTGAAAGPWGAVAGAAVGTAAGLAGGIVDVAMMNDRQAEAKNFKTDLYNMQLENIKALPNSLTKSSALSANNKIFPFLEYYSCTDEERAAFKEKIKYNGMTVGRIDILRNYLQLDFSWMQGKIIRIELLEDTHIANVIFEEVAKGVFIK